MSLWCKHGHSMWLETMPYMKRSLLPHETVQISTLFCFWVGARPGLMAVQKLHWWHYSDGRSIQAMMAVFRWKVSPSGAAKDHGVPNLTASVVGRFMVGQPACTSVLKRKTPLDTFSNTSLRVVMQKQGRISCNWLHRRLTFSYLFLEAWNGAAILQTSWLWCKWLLTRISPLEL